MGVHYGPTAEVREQNNVNIEEVTPFADQQKFMQACDQTTNQYNSDQYDMYLDLIKEEVEELDVALQGHDRVEQLDALIDILVVTIGAIHSGGFNGEAAWKEVMSTNFAKIDPNTGKVIKREDGKVLKPKNWQAPKLAPFITF
ncbi:MAG: nucleoside triphosphate pyrophosphohydrolase family protein [Euryarchaeota archaeon]|jgi:predicted HAD superfamily Cof-like phosphohydrolase